MKKLLLPFYDRQVLARPILTLLLVVLVTSFFAWYIQDFKLDVSLHRWQQALNASDLADCDAVNFDSLNLSPITFPGKTDSEVI